jgi:hypothetical protein
MFISRNCSQSELLLSNFSHVKIVLVKFSYDRKAHFMEQSFNAESTHYQVNNDSQHEDESYHRGHPIRIDIKHENDSATYDKQSSAPDKDIMKSFSSGFHLLSLTLQK